ncbi:P-II family nitrogen regulator [Treponema zioleckii]|uniref:P-II family nitrogen regulator n=1 Tax=Treponema zioleckii TaxID=331680 RepID=UPI00168A9FB9|nr:P-II family nitrogen regulator [Treponema zioleckii]
MSKLKLLISVVPHDKGEKLTRSAMESGCGGGTVLLGRGLAKSNLAAILGLGESSKDVILMIVSESSRSAIARAIKLATSHEKKGFGELFSCDIGDFFRLGSDEKTEGRENQKKENCMNEMITVIVNKGYADDVMAAARSAGATGGTVVNARGTARETDERFFGMHIVPEKEMLIMLVSSDKKDAVMNSIHQLKCLKEPGMGIAYSCGVENFSLLGKK